MAVLKRRRPDPPALSSSPQEQPKSLVAAAARIKLDGKSWHTYKFGDETWQQETWRLYDLIGEFRFSANWVGSMLSRVRIYVANLDKNGRVQQEVEKGKIASLSDTLFGGPSSKAEALRLLGINLTVAGDAFVVGEGTDDPKSDRWRVVSCSELKRRGQDFSYVNPDGSTEKIDLSNAIIVRVWTPHPRRYRWADCPAKAALPMLWEIERLTRYVFAQIDSRLISAGLFPIPKETSFPDMDPELGPAEALTNLLSQVGSASLKGEGTAAGVVPTFVEMPLEALGKLENIQFSSELSKQALDLRAEAIRRFALAMDMPPEVLTGTGDTNHWASWHVAENAIKVHIEPIMTRICEALTEAYLKPALEHIGEDPDRFTFWFDTAPLTVRPQRLEDTLNLYEKGVVKAEAVLIAGDYHLTDAPSAEEDLLRYTRELMLRDPNLFQIPAVRKVAGYTDEILPPNTVVTPQLPGQPGMPGAGPPPPPAPPTGIQPTQPPPIPENSQAQNALGGPPPPAGITASATVDPNAYAVANAKVFVVADAAVNRAMELAGKRLLDRHNRNNWPGVAAQDLHTRIRVGGVENARKLLQGAWGHLALLAEHLDPSLDTASLESTLDEYCSALLVQSHPHDSTLLSEVLRRKGFFREQS